VEPALRKAIFASPRPAPGKVTGGTALLENGDVAVFVVNAVRAGTPPTGDAAPFELAQVARNASNANALAEFTAYVKELERTAKIKLNDQVFGADQQP
jgi:hypothetical protein